MKKLKNIIAVFAFAMFFMWAGVSEYYAYTLNELQTNSTNLTFGQAATGTIVEDEEIDTYKFTVSQTGYFQLSFLLTENSKDDIGDGWNVKIYSANDLANCVREFNDVKANMTTAKMTLPMGDYFVFVEECSTDYNTDDSEYSIKADYVVDSHWETESNDDNRKPNVINVNEQYKAVHTVIGDKDWYKFTTPTDGKFSVSFSLSEETDIDAIGDGWDLFIYDSAFNELKVYYDIKADFTTVELPFSKGTYYVQVGMHSDYYTCLDCVYSIKVNHKAADRWESEYNNNNSTAEVINVNEVWNGSLYKEEDEDWYKFTTTKDGKFSISFSIDSATDIEKINDGWNLTIYDSEFNELKVYPDIKTGFTTAELPFSKGTYYAKVKMESINYPCLDCVYGIKVNYTTPARWESEYNDKNTQADIINVNEMWNGNLYHTEDVDWYKFTTAKDGKFSVSFSIDAATDIEKIGDGWDLFIYDSAFNEIKKYSDIKTGCTTVELPFSKGTYYVKVGMHSAYYPCLDCTYGIKVNYTTPARWESEYNDKNTQADIIKVNEVWNGSTYKTEDVDWYKFSTTKAGYFQVEFGVPKNVDNNSIGNGWYMIIYDKNYTVIKEINDIKSNMKSVILPYGKDTFYIEVGVEDAYNPCLDCNYTLRVINKASASYESEANDVLKKADTITLGKTYNGVTNNKDDQDWYKFKVAKNGALKFELKKHASASIDDIGAGWYYIIYDANKKEVATVNDIKSKGVTTVNLKKGTYYVVVGVQDSWSAPLECSYTISTKFGPAPSASNITSIKSKAKKVTLKWKNSKDATGYYIYRATSKNGTYKKVATVKGAKNTTCIDKKGLKKKATYYYKVVAYKTTNKITATAKASNIKNVKVR